MSKIIEDMRNESFKEGVKEGARKAAGERSIKMAKEMLSDGILPFEKIAKYSDLSIEEVKELQNEKT